ncbi:hypothetical protein [Streptomyces sp. NPDC053726]|uniref:hypothetical protein n=1 Tax=Streptomyces sp. NPDC053726 TaxID=3365713 RepID=UPI0037CE0CDF
MSDTGSAADALDTEAAGRRRGRNPGGSRTANRRAKTAQERAAAREEERQERQKAAEKKAEEEKAETAGPKDEQQEPAQDNRRAKQIRPKAIPFYPDPSDETFLWQVTQAGAARQERIPHTAVLRLALRRLANEMQPDDIVRELGGPVQSTGKRGRPRK